MEDITQDNYKQTVSDKEKLTGEPIAVLPVKGTVVFPALVTSLMVTEARHTKLVDETLMAGKMLTCLERSFQVGETAIAIKGRDFYDLLWFMQQRIQPFDQKLESDGSESYNVRSAMLAIQEKVREIKQSDLKNDLLPLFEQRTFIEAWIASFHENFEEYLQYYI